MTCLQCIHLRTLKQHITTVSTLTAIGRGFGYFYGTHEVLHLFNFICRILLQAIQTFGGEYEKKQNDFDEEDILDIVDEALEEAFINTDERLIIWPSGERLTIDQTAEKINKENEFDNEVVKNCIMAWVEMDAQSEATNKKPEDIFVEDIQNWVNDYYIEKNGFAFGLP